MRLVYSLPSLRLANIHVLLCMSGYMALSLHGITGACASPWLAALSDN